MYCHKCGGSIVATAAKCDHCGAGVDHRTNMDAFLLQEEKLRISKNVWTHPKKLAAYLVVLIALIAPMLPLPYVFEHIAEHYRLSDFLALTILTLAIIIMLAIAVKKGFSKHISTQKG